MDRHELSACMGMWRMGVDDATIAAILDKELWEIFRAIKTYKSTLK